jgi:hypothetical protein
VAIVMARRERQGYWTGRQYVLYYTVLAASTKKKRSRVAASWEDF